MPEVYLDLRGTPTIKLFLRFLQRSTTLDVRLGLKYAPVYIYVQITHIEVIYALSIFAVKYIFS